MKYYALVSFRTRQFKPYTRNVVRRQKGEQYLYERYFEPDWFFAEPVLHPKWFCVVVGLVYNLFHGVFGLNPSMVSG